MSLMGRYTLGNGMTTQSEIARLAKTSLKTVSRVINKDPLVNEGTRRRIEAIIAKVGYTPNQAARMMRSQRSNIIGFLADQVATTSSSIELVRGAQEVAWERGKQMMLFNIERGNESEQLADAQLSEFRAESIIYAAVFHQRVKLRQSDVPHVLLNCFESEARYPTVLPDDYRLAYDLTEEFIRRGYKNPIYLNLADSVAAAPLRAKGFVDAGAKHGLDFSSKVLVATAPPEHGHVYSVDTLLADLMDRSPRPDIVVCGQDLMALPVYFTLTALGYKVGRDVGVVSFDNLQPLASLMQPGLSTMELPYHEMGRAAMTAAIDGTTFTEPLLVRGRFIDRSSL